MWSKHSATDILESLIHQAEEAGASDIHLHRRNESACVSLRLDGVMTTLAELPEEMAERLFGRIKFLARLKTYQDSLPQDGRINRSDVAAHSDIRVATYPTVTGEKIVLRLFGSTTSRSLQDLGFSTSALAELEKFLKQTAGLLLLTGPAGSGKTTTIYACLRHLAADGSRHIITVEDPVEQMVPGIMQTEVNEARGLTFSKAARHLLRQDPQVMVIGEIRDDETADIAVRAALTGHLVISTLHAGSCKGVLERLLVMCPDRYAVVSVVGLILNQRLVRRWCQNCHGTGCDDCLKTGYRGCVPVVEWLRVDNPLKQQLREQGPHIVVPNELLSASAQELLRQRVTDDREVRRVLGI